MPAEDDVLSVPIDVFASDLAINTISPYAAAQEAVKGFAELPSTASKTFIQIGNVLNRTVMPSLITLGVGKSAAAHMIACCAESYQAKGYQ
jgi:hypothetical protein